MLFHNRIIDGKSFFYIIEIEELKLLKFNLEMQIQLPTYQFREW
jgi:hypothetical protein